jgi:hypothetical protein
MSYSCDIDEEEKIGKQSWSWFATYVLHRDRASAFTICVFNTRTTEKLINYHVKANWGWFEWLFSNIHTIIKSWMRAIIYDFKQMEVEEPSFRHKSLSSKKKKEQEVANLIL